MTNYELIFFTAVMCVCMRTFVRVRGCVHVYSRGSSQVCYFIYATFPPFTLPYNQASAYGQCWKREGEQLLFINRDMAQYFQQMSV